MWLTAFVTIPPLLSNSIGLEGTYKSHFLFAFRTIVSNATWAVARECTGEWQPEQGQPRILWALSQPVLVLGPNPDKGGER